MKEITLTKTEALNLLRTVEAGKFERSDYRTLDRVADKIEAIIADLTDASKQADKQKLVSLAAGEPESQVMARFALDQTDINENCGRESVDIVLEEADFEFFETRWKKATEKDLPGRRSEREIVKAVDAAFKHAQAREIEAATKD